MGCYVCRLFLAIFGGVVRQVSDGSHSIQVVLIGVLIEVGYRVCVFGSVSEFR